MWGLGTRVAPGSRATVRAALPSVRARCVHQPGQVEGGRGEALQERGRDNTALPSRTRDTDDDAGPVELALDAEPPHLPGDRLS